MTHARKFWNDLSVLLAIQVGAFLVFHLNLALLFDVDFNNLMRAHEWPRTISISVHLAAQYAPIAIFLGLVFRGEINRVLSLAMAVSTFYYAYFWAYPLLTAFLFEIGQMEKFGEFFFDRLPLPSEYPELAE